MNMDFCVKILNDYDSVNSAKRLLYEVYIHEMGWDFREDSPTGFRIAKDKLNEPILCDAFDDDAIWFGAYKDDKIIGVTRAVQRSNALGKLDLELYPASELPSMRRIFRGNESRQLVEVQRGAVAKDYRNTKPSIIQLLLSFVFSYAQEYCIRDIIQPGRHVFGGKKFHVWRRRWGMAHFYLLLSLDRACASCEEAQGRRRKEKVKFRTRKRTEG